MQEPLISQPITLVEVAAYQEALHAAEDHEAGIAALHKEAKEDVTEARKNLRKIRQRVNAAAQREGAGSIMHELARQLDGEVLADGRTVSVKAGRGR